MSQMVERILTALHAALETRELYSADHAAAAARLDGALALLTEHLRTQPSLDLVLLPDRIVVGEETVKTAADLSRGLFGRLRARGVAGISFTSGVERAEIDALLAAAERREPPGALESSRHVRLMALGAEDQARDRRRPIAPGAKPSHSAESFAALVDPLAASALLDAERLETLAGELSAVVAATDTTLIPLASLRSHDEYTYVHTINVAMLSGGLAQAVGLSADKVLDITSAALLHDVGKCRVPPELLNKNGKLSDDELKIVRLHPVEGARILLGIHGAPELAVIVAYEHHMHRTGGGYPAATGPWRMHLGSQIVQVADIFDALRTNRPYRAAMTLEQAHETMRKDSPKVFDKALLDAFFTIVAPRTDRDAKAA